MPMPDGSVSAVAVKVSRVGVGWRVTLRPAFGLRNLSGYELYVHFPGTYSDGCCCDGTEEGCGCLVRADAGNFRATHSHALELLRQVSMRQTPARPLPCWSFRQTRWACSSIIAPRCTQYIRCQGTRLNAHPSCGQATVVPVWLRDSGADQSSLRVWLGGGSGWSRPVALNPAAPGDQVPRNFLDCSCTALSARQLINVRQCPATSSDTAPIVV